MHGWFEKKNRLEKLQHQYQELMRDSFELALKDKIASDLANERACNIYKEIIALKNDQDMSYNSPKYF